MNRERKAKRFFLPRKLHVWGAGTDAPDHSFSGRHYYHAVRGSKTAEQIVGGNAKPVLGDPGLLASHWLDGRPKPHKRYKLGVMPHYVDKADPSIAFLQAQDGVKVVDVFWPVEEVLRAVQQCEFVISSSMHGLIVSDSFGVPNRRLVLSQGVLSDYKFLDYYSAYGTDEPAHLKAKDVYHLDLSDPAPWIGENHRPGLDAVCSDLIAAFPQI